MLTWRLVGFKVDEVKQRREKMFGLVKQSTYDSVRSHLNAVQASVAALRNDNFDLGVENMALKAKLKAYQTVNKPIQGKDGRWRNSSTQQFVKAPDPIREEAKAKRAKADAAYKRLNVEA